MSDAIQNLLALLFEPEQSMLPSLHRYAVVDPAQDKQLPAALHATISRCLLGEDDAIRDASPHLVALPDDRDAKRTWHWIGQNAPKSPCMILLSSTLDFDALHQHLLSFIDVRVNSSTTMLLAWWDAMIMAALIGQPDDTTLHVKGPVFDIAQRAAFLAPLHTIGYWDRLGKLRSIDPTKLDSRVPAAKPGTIEPALPLAFNPEQVRQLVETGLPDHILYELRLNRPGVLSDRSEWDNYAMTCRLLDAAHTSNIKSLRDLVNFVGTGMILGEHFYRHPVMVPHLQPVAVGQKTFTDMLGEIRGAALAQVQNDERADSEVIPQ